MTQPIGAPDWLTSVPGAAKSLDRVNYNAVVTPVATFQGGNVQAYRAIAVKWQPAQPQVLTFDFYDDALFTQLVMSRQVTADSPATAQFTIPTLGAYVNIYATRQDGFVGVSGSISLSGIVSADRAAAVRGVTVLSANTNFTVAANSTDVREFLNVAEGLASVYVRSTATAYSVSVQALSPANVWTLLAQVNNTDPTPSRFSLHMPPWQGRIQFVNNDAALRAVAYAVTVGD